MKMISQVRGARKARAVSFFFFCDAQNEECTARLKRCVVEEQYTATVVIIFITVAERGVVQ